MDSIINNIIFYDINDYIILINNLGVFIYNHSLEIILKYNIFNIIKFSYSREKYIAYTKSTKPNIINILYNKNNSQSIYNNQDLDSSTYDLKKEIYIAYTITQFYIFDKYVFISDYNYIYIFCDTELVDKIPKYLKSQFNIKRSDDNDIFKIIYQNDSLNLIKLVLDMNNIDIKNSKNLIPHKSEINKFNISYDGKYLLTTSIKGTILRMFSIENLTLIKEFRIGYVTSNINSITISECNKWIILNYNKNYIKIFDNNSKYESYLNILESYYSYLYIEDINFKVGYSKQKDDIFYCATETGKLITVLIKKDESEILKITRFMDNNFNDMINMNLSFG